jgi:hypothetical protein
MKKLVILFLILIGTTSNGMSQIVTGVACSGTSDQINASGPYFGQPDPGTIPKRFAPSKIPQGAWGITFSPDGTECFITQIIDSVQTLLTSKETGGSWPDLSVPPFSGTYFDMESHITPDGERMYFGSMRPLTGVTPGFLYQWYVDKTDTGWSAAKPMDAPLFGQLMMFPSVSANKNMYFTASDGVSNQWIAVSRFVNGVYHEPVPLDDSVNSMPSPAHPFIALDESYIIFDAVTDSTNWARDLYICYRKPDSTWTHAINLGTRINNATYSMCPFVSRDGKYFFFYKDVYMMWVDAGFIDNMKPLAGPYLGQTPPDTVPVRFAPSSLQATYTWSWHGSPSFSPDLKEMFFVKYLHPIDKTEINYMKMVDGMWTDPVKPSFASDTFIDNNPVFSPSGDTVYFYSQRPGGPYFYVIRQDGDWSVPVPLHVPMPDSLSPSWQFFIARDKTFYFDLWQKAGDIDIYTSEWVNGEYTEPVKLGLEINTSYQDWGACLDPDERVMIFSSNRPGGYGLHDLYRTVKNTDGTWSEAVNLGNNINGPNEDGFPSISPDGQYFFFTSAKSGDLNYNPYWVKATTVAPVLGVNDVRRESQDLILRQNFPNPCSGKTTLEFSLGKREHVVMKLTDLFGREVKTLVNEIKEPGRYRINSNLTNLPGGLYFCYLTNGVTTRTIKIVIE